MIDFLKKIVLVKNIFKFKNKNLNPLISETRFYRSNIVIVNLEKQVSDLIVFLVKNSICSELVSVSYPSTNDRGDVEIVIKSEKYNFNKNSPLFKDGKNLINFVCEELKI